MIRVVWQRRNKGCVVWSAYGRSHIFFTQSFLWTRVIHSCGRVLYLGYPLELSCCDLIFRYSWVLVSVICLSVFDFFPHGGIWPICATIVSCIVWVAISGDCDGSMICERLDVGLGLVASNRWANSRLIVRNSVRVHCRFVYMLPSKTRC